MTIILQFYPNGEFSQGVDTSASRRANKERRDRIIERRDADISTQTLEYASIVPLEGAEAFERPGTQYTNRRGDIVTVLHSCQEGVTLTWEDEHEGKGVYTTAYSIYDMIRRGELTPLVYRSVESCDKRENRKKLETMTKRMALRIRNAAFLLERRKGGKDVLSFLTLTLPSLSHDGLQACITNWDKLVKRFMDWLRVTLERKNIKFEYVYCTEIQQKRLEKTHEYAPHLHIIFRGRDGKKKPWAITPKQARKAWKRCILGFTSEQFDCSALENLQRVRKSAGRYLSKYLSKGAKIDTLLDEGLDFTPLRTQWGGMARSLSQSIRHGIVRLGASGNARELVLAICRHMGELVENGFVRYWKEGFIPLSHDPISGATRGLHVGRGCLSLATYCGGVAHLLAYCERTYVA